MLFRFRQYYILRKLIDFLLTCLAFSSERYFVVGPKNNLICQLDVFTMELILCEYFFAFDQLFGFFFKMILWFLSSSTFLVLIGESHCCHRCTRVENPGNGVLHVFFFKTFDRGPWCWDKFQSRIPYFCILLHFLVSFGKNFLGVTVLYLPYKLSYLRPTPYTPCASIIAV